MPATEGKVYQLQREGYASYRGKVCQLQKEGMPATEGRYANSKGLFQRERFASYTERVRQLQWEGYASYRGKGMPTT